VSPISEIDAIKALDETMAQLPDPQARNRVLKWAWDKYSTEPSPAPEEASARKLKKPRKAARTKTKRATKAKSKGKPTIVKDLNLTPKGKKAFTAFAQEKGPKDNQQKCVVAVYYLRHELALDKVSIDHVYTCYKDAKWRVPANLYHTLVLTAHRKGWLDTTDMTSITITARGENLVEQDLPRKPNKAR